MTAVIVQIQKEAAFVVTDGLASNPDKRSPLCKVATFAHLRAAIIVRGQIHIGAGFSGYVNYMRHSFEEAAKNFANDLRHVRCQLANTLPGNTDAQAVLVGWPDAAASPVGFYAESGEAGETGPTQFAHVVMPSLPGLAATSLPAGAVALIAAQREAYPDDVGGFVELTTIRRERITSEILHRWPEDFTA